MKILICTDGSHAAAQAAVLVSRLGLPGSTRMTVLGVVENENDRNLIKASVDKISASLGAVYIIDTKVRHGNPVEEILAEALEFSFDLVAVGGEGQHLGLMHHKLGTTTSKLAHKLHTHFIVARQVPAELSRILVCTGAESPLVETMVVGGELLSHLLNARIALLHVASKNTLRSDETDLSATEGAKLAIERKTRQGQLLLRARQQLRDAGVQVEIIPRLRFGVIIDEVLAELKEGMYELLVVGAHYQPGQDRWLGTLLDDVTDQLLNQATSSVLII